MYHRVRDLEPRDIRKSRQYRRWLYEVRAGCGCISVFIGLLALIGIAVTTIAITYGPDVAGITIAVIAAITFVTGLLVILVKDS